MAHVDFVMENAEKCLCGGCPVETASECVKPIRQKVLPTIEEGKLPEPSGSEIDGLYCAVGKTPCTDFDVNAACQCPKCGVWKDVSLAKQYYCGNGSADEIG